MESIVLNKFAHISDAEDVCICDENCYKVCKMRIRDNLDCREMIIRFTPVDRDTPDLSSSTNLNLSGLNREFEKTLKHLKKIR